MTTIVYDRFSLYGDRKRSLDHNLHVEAKKVYKVSEPNLDLIGNSETIQHGGVILVGCAGDSSICSMFSGYLLGQVKIKPPKPFSFSCLIASNYGLYEIDENFLAVYLTGITQYSIGTGSAYANAALACGKTGGEAIAVASIFDNHTSSSYDCESL